MKQSQSLSISALVAAIYEADYYVSLFERTCGPDIDNLHTNPKAITLLNNFWFALPDNKSIRTPVFFQLCGVIEDANEDESACPCGADGGTSCGDPNCEMLGDPAF